MYLRDLCILVKLPFCKDRELYHSFHQMLGFYPIHIEYYKQALMHKSASVKGENGKPMNNERLEFLGDAILDAIVGDIVYRRFQGKREGFLTNARSKIVQRESLGRLAHEIGLDRLIQSNDRRLSHNSYMAGNAFEALVGAVYLDRGYDYCMRFMQRRILNSLINIDKVAYKEVNFKSKLLEWSQKNRITLEFRLVGQEAVANANTMFHTEVVIEGIACGKGSGYSKKESQQNASKDALTRLRKDKQLEARCFEAKSQRTQMEEMPQMQVPDVVPAAPQEQKTGEAKPTASTPDRQRDTTRQGGHRRQSGRARASETSSQTADETEIDFGDISFRQPTRDEIIAQAEEAAFRQVQS